MWCSLLREPVERGCEPASTRLLGWQALGHIGLHDHDVRVYEPVLNPCPMQMPRQSLVSRSAENAMDMRLAFLYLPRSHELEWLPVLRKYIALGIILGHVGDAARVNRPDERDNYSALDALLLKPPRDALDHLLARPYGNQQHTEVSFVWA